MRIIKDSLLHIVHSKGWAFSPDVITIDLTHKCNLKCFFCYYHGKGGLLNAWNGNGSDGVPWNCLVENVISRVSCSHYHLTGGEPFLYPGFKDLLLALKQFNKRVVVSTNGTLITADWAEQIVSEKLLDTIHFSIHGDKEIHDKITRKSGAFQLACNAIKVIQEYKEICGEKYPQVGIDCVVTTENVGKLEKLASIAADWNVYSLTIGNTVFTRPDIMEKHRAVSRIENLREDFGLSGLVLGPPGHEFSDGDVRIYLDDLKRIEDLWGQKYSILRWPPYDDDDIYRHYFDDGWMFRERCDYPWHSMRIHPSGSVIPCLGVVVGDIREKGADRIWNNVHYRKFRKALFKNKLFPGCFRCCKLQ